VKLNQEKTNNMINTLKQWYWAITLVFCALLFLGQCSSNRRIDALKKDNSKLQAKVDSLQAPLSERETKDIVQNIMFDFLIFEDDLDKSKTSLTDIRTKIDKD
jgi:hypothetical protein